MNLSRKFVLAGIGEIANIPNPKPQKFWTDRSVVWMLIFLDKFEKISSADFIAKNLKTISSAEFIDADFIKKKICTADFIEKIFHCWFHWKKFLKPQTPTRPTSRFQTPNADFHGPTGRTFLRFLLG